MSAISKSAMIARLTIRHWNPLIQDKYVTNKVEFDYNVSNRGYWNKWRVAKDSVDLVRRIINEARKFHYENTLPWLDGGDRLLPTKNYQDYTAGMRAYKGQFDAAVNEFVTNYMSYVSAASTELGQMFNSGEYPDASEIDKYFEFNTALSNVPNEADFRCEMNEADVQEVREQISEQNTKAISSAVSDLWDRLETVVDHAANSLGAKDKIFRNTLIGNIDQVADMIPRLNFSDDKELAALAKEAKDKVAQYSPKFLRNNVHARAEAAAHAKDVKAKIGKVRPPKKKGNKNDAK